MSQEKQHNISLDFQFRGIELLGHSISAPLPVLPVSDFVFDVNVQTNLDADQKLVFAIVNITIQTGDQLHILGSMSASSIFFLSNFEEIVTIDDQGNHAMPRAATDMFNSIAISTTRGLMFATFKGTFLHNAILPVIVPASFQQLETASGDQLHTKSSSVEQ